MDTSFLLQEKEWLVVDKRLNIEYMDVDDLIPYINNPRENDNAVDKVASSIESFGFKNPIIIDSDNEIIAGHTRLKAAKKLGIKEVPVIKANDLTQAQIKAFRIADNKTSEFAEWDFDLLETELRELEELDFDLELTGFELDELDKVLMTDQEIKEDEFDVEEELKEPAISKQGDVWLLGRHRLICGDSTKEDTYKILMDGKKANLVVTDPPYNVAYEAKAGTIKNDDMKSDDFYSFLLAAFKNMHSSMELDASIYVFHADTEGLNFRKSFVDAGFYLSGVCIWAKQSIVLGRSPYQWKHEPILFGWRKDGKHRWYSDRKQNTIWNFDRPTKSDLHPTMKPVELCAYPIQNSSMSNCIILDPFGGSGSTLMACEQTGRICYSIELDEKYTDVIVKRYIEYAGTDEDVFLIRSGEKTNYKEIHTNN
ncbi:DNA methylase N-4/N-6 domain protein [Alkaliphilus metalliredigens QYMF]|uniref:Methyltransferase n=1 Tax=Alkaliphilus metalliredigens (strain QYMF) TaxID=293826 RepID=A6TRB6_ALKMQ|nr:DNA methylase N-4/N-6 domain protein [Alkaliphilus metalliredigens QYMF]